MHLENHHLWPLDVYIYLTTDQQVGGSNPPGQADTLDYENPTEAPETADSVGFLALVDSQRVSSTLGQGGR